MSTKLMSPRPSTYPISENGSPGLPEASNRRSRALKGRRRPTYRLVPPSDGSRGPEAIRLAAAAGLKLDLWQGDVLIDGMATLGDRWAADEVAEVLSRQNGKTVPLVVRAVWGPTLGGEQLVLFTSHEFKTCREAFLLAKSLCDTPALQQFRPKVSVSHGFEGISFANGRLLFIARSRTSGRGFSPDCVILDEAFELDDLALAALKPSLAAAATPQLWYASSAPHDTSTVLRRLAVKGRSGDARRLCYLEWCAPDDLPRDDPKAWVLSNPGLGHRIDPDFITSELDSLAPGDFERERLGRWDEEVGGQWIPDELWAACEVGTDAVPTSNIVLALTGSSEGTITALVGCTVDDPPHVFIAGYWENEDGVPVLEVEQAIRSRYGTGSVVQIAADPARWARTIQVLGAEGLPVVEYPLTPARMIPASTRFHEAVVNRQLTQDGHDDLAAHISNAVVKVDSRGSRITRESRYSLRRIDLAVAAVVAHDLACDLKAQAFRVY